MAIGTNESLAANAAAHLRRSGHTVKGGSGNSKEIDRQSVTLLEWARSKKVVLTDNFLVGLKKHADSTAEHEVYYRAADNRAVKLTHPGTFGVTPDKKGNQQAATPLFYLIRLELMNRVFGSDFRLEGIALGKSLVIGASGEYPRMVVSQPWIQAADICFPVPSSLEITNFMDSLGFVPLPGSYYGWIRKADNVQVLDARPDNFIKSNRGVTPIDLVISQD
ncbi:MAG TPA: hypothetical protein VMA13_02755 [Candidatus Saccharimonadales bacterium]|nr:hypothetical protein [Candidatus Saccharimonadales bacterium]